MAGTLYPLYPTAVIVPILAFPSWILCIPPLYWHFSQGNVAAGSLILWMTMLNFFNSINPLIWPRDNVLEWWNGNGLCDIEVHIKVCAVVATTSCAAVIARKLAGVMDTRNITVAPSRNTRITERVLEVWWCWGFPLVLTALYYIAQPSRYFIFAISGCVAAYDTSWPSIIVSWMWGPITTFVGAFYAGKLIAPTALSMKLIRTSGLLILRLFRYRREFHRLVAARNTTKSRFLRLFLMAILFITLFLPYTLYILYVLASTVEDPYDWNLIHGPNWNVIIKVPTQGGVRFDIWAEIATGYLLFLLFGTGTDAHNTYKRMLCAFGLGKIFPGLYVMHGSGSSTPSSVTFAKGFASSCASKAKIFFSKSDSVTEIPLGSASNDSICFGTPTTTCSGQLTHTSTNEPIIPQNVRVADQSSTNGSFFNRMFNRRNAPEPALPIVTTRSIEQVSAFDMCPVASVPPVVHARAWASERLATGRHHSADGVHSEDGVHSVHELHQARCEDDGTQKQTDASYWA